MAEEFRQQDTPVTDSDSKNTSEQSGKPAHKENIGATIGKTVLFYLHDLAYLLCIFLVVLLVVFRVVVVSGPSMMDTLVNGDTLLVLSGTFYPEPEHGDIVIISKQSFENGDPIIKRVIATENQWVDIDFQNGIVYVGDTEDTMQALDEPYIRALTKLPEGTPFPLQVPKGCIFVMGDNRPESKDSRSPEIGIIDNREVIGKAFFLILPGTGRGDGQRDFSRIGVLN